MDHQISILNILDFVSKTDSKRPTCYRYLDYHPIQCSIFHFKKSYYQIQILQKLIIMWGKSQQKIYHQIQILQIMLSHEKLIGKCDKSQQKSCHQIQILQLTQITWKTDRHKWQKTTKTLPSNTDSTINVLNEKQMGTCICNKSQHVLTVLPYRLRKKRFNCIFFLFYLYI